MRPAVSYHLAPARITDLRHHAQRTVLARAARRARTGPRGRGAPLLPTPRRLARDRPSPPTRRQVPVAGSGRRAGRTGRPAALRPGGGNLRAHRPRYGAIARSALPRLSRILGLWPG